MIPDKGFFGNVWSFAHDHPYITKGTLGTAVIGYALWDGGSRVVSWFRGEKSKTDEKTQEAADKKFSGEPTSALDPQKKDSSGITTGSSKANPTQPKVKLLTEAQFEGEIQKAISDISKLRAELKELGYYSLSNYCSAKLQEAEEIYRRAASTFNEKQKKLLKDEPSEDQKAKLEAIKQNLAHAQSEYLKTTDIETVREDIKKKINETNKNQPPTTEN